jgi:hypothetical protein
MLTLQTRLRVDGISASEIFEFLANPTDESYRRWWPGTHLQLHLLERHAGHVRDVVYMDEYVGRRRLRMRGIVIEAEPGRRLVWQLKKVIRLPARIELELREYEGGVGVTHTTRAGFRGPGRVVDPLFRIYFSERFVQDLDEHVKTEFPLLRDLLARRRERTQA